MNEKNCLRFNPFEGDRGSPGDKTLEDKMVTARKGGPCHICPEPITPGMRIRVLKGVYDGEFMAFRWCQPCCEAMAKSWADEGKAIAARFTMRWNHDHPEHQFGERK